MSSVAVPMHTPVLLLGPVKSGKTSALIREAVRFQVRGLKIITIKHSIDFREHDARGLLKSRDGTQLSNNVVADTLSYADMAPDLPEAAVLAIDEGQFFGDSLVPFVEEATQRGHRVMVAALNGDFRREPFACIAILAARSHVHCLAAICQRCGNDAVHSKKIGGNSQQVIEVDSAGVSYEPRCTNCHPLD